MYQKPAYITEEQDKFLDERGINFSKFVRNAIEERRKEIQE